MRINQNVAAFNAFRNLSNTQNQLSSSLEKLSSGFRINRAADDAAGLVRSETLRSQIGGLKVAVRNAQDGISVIQTAEGALTETTSILQRMRDLAVQSANAGANSQESLDANQAEFAQLIAELNRIAGDTKFGGQNLLNGTYNGSFQLGANAGESVAVAVGNMAASALGVADADPEVATPVVAVSDLSIASAGGLEEGGDTTDITAWAGAQQAIQVLDAALGQVSEQRADLGAVQNRFESTIRNLSVTVENLSAAESRIRDTDMAQEMVSFTRHQILQQAGTAMLAQANQVPQSVLSLLR
jgi:flagellin